MEFSSGVKPSHQIMSPEKGFSLPTDLKKLKAENEEFQTQIEALKQEKHSLRLNCDLKSQMIESQNFEIEAQKKTYDHLNQRKNQLEKDNIQLSKKLKGSVAEIQELRNDVEELIMKNNDYKAKILDLENQLQSSQKDEQIIHNESSSEDLLKVLQEFNTCQNKKRELESFVCELETKLYQAKTTEERLSSTLKDLQEHINEKNEELQTYSQLIEKSKEENAELQATIEILKLEQFDEKRRGNSVFGEVDDRRKAAEREYILLREKYKAMKENHDRTRGEINKLRKKFAFALGLSRNEADLTYMKELETKLCEARKEIEQLTNALTEKKRSQMQLIPQRSFTEFGDNDDYGYLQILLMQSRKKNEKLQAEVEKLRFLNVAETNKLIDCEHELHQSKRTVEAFRREMIKMKLEIEELSQSKEPIVHKEKVEIIPGFAKEDLEHEHKDGNVDVEEKPEDELHPSEIIDKIQDSKDESQETNCQQKKLTIQAVNKDTNASPQMKTISVKRNIKYATAPTVNMNIARNECIHQ